MSHHSLLDGLSKEKQIAERCEQLGYSACAISDHGTISAAVDIVKEFKKKNIKPILGTEFYLSDVDSSIKTSENRNKHHLVVLAKNIIGWRNLIKATSQANKDFYYKPRISLNKLAEFTDGCVSFSGHMGSELANCLFEDVRLAYRCQSVEEVYKCLFSDAKEKAIAKALEYEGIFGRGNFFLEIQLIDREFLPAAIVVSEVLREVSKFTGIPCVATPDAHYPSKDRAEDQRVLLCNALKLKMANVMQKVDNGEEVGLGGFFRSTNYHIPSLEEMQVSHTEEEIRQSAEIADMCEEYNILSSKPLLPKFPCPDGRDEFSFLQEIANQGLVKKAPDNENFYEYEKRMYKELEVIKEAGIAGYMLIVRDYLEAARKRGELVGPGRGSIGGSLVAYLCDITTVDSIKYDLLFERFYNAGRNTKDRISMPDIDCDFEKAKRHLTIEYIKNKYGKDKVSSIITFGRMQGRSAIKDVLSVYQACSFDEMNAITEHIPDEAAISDELQEMVEEEGESSIIKWSLEHNSKELSPWCSLKDNGELEGPFAQYFAQAIRLEGTKKTAGIHAAGIVISSEKLENVCPMVYNKNSEDLVAGMDMNALEGMGHLKFDILATTVLDKIAYALKIMRGEI